MLYNVHIEIRVPDAELVIKQQPDKDLDVAIRDAFDSARRQLEDFVRQRRGGIKHHEETPHGEITALFTDKGYGFLTTPDGLCSLFREIEFVQNL